MYSQIAQQTMIEHQTLKHVMDGLQIVLTSQVSAAGMARKLTSLRFVVSSLHRHLEHMLNLEESGGYMPEVVAMSPQFAKEVKALRQQHDEFRETLRHIVAELEAVTADDTQRITATCERLSDLLNQLDKHSRTETGLVQEAFLREEGGEG